MKENPRIQIDTLPVGPLQANCYIIKDELQQAAIVIDPGAEGERIIAAVGDRKTECILLTHAHYDHIGALEAVRQKTGAPVFIHPAEAEWLTNPALNGSLGPWSWGEPIQCSPADGSLTHGQAIPFAGIELVVAHTPGHSPGGVSFVGPGFAFTGDALFRGSIGRTDLPFGDGQRLLESIRLHLLSLPDDTVVFPGHGPATTVGEERAHNPFLAS